LQIDPQICDLPLRYQNRRYHEIFARKNNGVNVKPEMHAIDEFNRIEFK